MQADVRCSTCSTDGQQYSIHKPAGLPLMLDLVAAALSGSGLSMHKPAALRADVQSRACSSSAVQCSLSIHKPAGLPLMLGLVPAALTDSSIRYTSLLSYMLVFGPVPT